MIDQFNNVRSTILGVKEVPLQDVSKYGIVAPSRKSEDLYKINGLIEKPSIEKAPSNQAIIGRYILSPQIFAILENGRQDAEG